MEKLRVIGTAMVDLKLLDKFYQEETEKYRKKESSWIGSLWREYFFNNQELLNSASTSFYFQKSGFVNEPWEPTYRELKETQEYLDRMDLAWDLLYHDDISSLVRYGEISIVLPSSVICQIVLFENLDRYSIGELRGMLGPSVNALVPDSGISRMELKNKIDAKQDEIKKKQREVEDLEKERDGEIQKIIKEIEARYKAQFERIQKKKEEMEIQMEQLKNQMFLLDTELYSIRCFMGETVRFIKLTEGKPEMESEPVVLYQKIRFLDEEMGKFLSIYGFSGGNIKLFEDALRVREDLRNIFAPPGKSISLVKISRTGVQYGQDEMIANMLKKYKAYHGKQIGIIIRNGENCYIGWTDEDRIHISSEDAFLTPKTTIGDEEEKSTSREEIASRYFIFAILQGILGKLLNLPTGTSVFSPNPYVVYSMADGWIEDNRFGYFSDIVKRTNSQKMQVGDMVLTTMRITRDDAGFHYGSRSTQYDAYNNDRGRGEKNRTHDASLCGCTLYPVNCIDTIETYDILCKKYKCDVFEVVDSREETGEGAAIISHNETKRTEEIIGEEKERIIIENGFISGIKNPLWDVRKLSPEQILKKYLGLDKRLWRKFEKNIIEYVGGEAKSAYYLIPYKMEKLDTEYHYFLSAEKDGEWEKRRSHANMEIFSGEYLNLTYLNSVYVTYAIQNRKIGGWSIGGTEVDYAHSLKYLNVALEYLREREEKEAKLLLPYMELYPDWQVDLSEWRMEHGYHSLTPARAKKFAEKK